MSVFANSVMADWLRRLRFDAHISLANASSRLPWPAGQLEKFELNGEIGLREIRELAIAYKINPEKVMSEILSLQEALRSQCDPLS